MKPVFGLLMIFVGLTVGYLVITGKLPNQAGSTVPGHKVPGTNITGATTSVNPRPTGIIPI